LAPGGEFNRWLLLEEAIEPSLELMGASEARIARRTWLKRSGARGYTYAQLYASVHDANLKVRVYYMGFGRKGGTFLSPHLCPE
jgi:hypothetical protein